MITFRDFMESSLYAPGRGFYETRVPTADFYTAPELHPAFAHILADEAAFKFEALAAQKVQGPYCLVEMGSGSGKLGRNIRRSLRERHSKWSKRVNYVLVERSQRMLYDSVLTLADDGGNEDDSETMVMGYRRLEDVPPCAGVFISNELVDAFPVHLLERRGDRMFEVYVQDGSREILGELSSAELLPHARRILPHLPDGGRHSVNLEARHWIRLVSKKLQAGALITVDYGRRYSEEQPILPRTFYKHTMGEDLLARAGEQDLTSSVDFEALVQEGAQFGLRSVSYSTLGRFLLDRGILELMPEIENPSDTAVYKERAQIKTLFHPDGMGERFKVLIQEKLSLPRPHGERAGMRGKALR